MTRVDAPPMSVNGDQKPGRTLEVAGMVSLGLGVQAAGYALGRSGNSSGAIALFFAGLAMIFVPCAWRLLGKPATRSERLQVSVLLGLALFLSYFLRDPSRLDQFDELLHVTTLHQLIFQRHLFTENAVLPVSPYYPGLELITIIVHWTTGLPMIGSQLLVLLACRLLLVVALFLIVEQLTGSSRTAGIGVLAYSTSPQLYAFNSQFAYQTLALPLALAVVYLLLRSTSSPEDRRGRRFALVVACLGALTISHHILSWVTVALLIVWAVALFAARRHAAAKLVGRAAAVGVAFVATWTALSAGRLARYLGPIFRTAYNQIWGYLHGTQLGRSLFQDPAGVQTPDWERALLIASALIWMGLIVAAASALIRGRILRDNPLRWVLLAVAATYPLLLAVRISSQGGEIGDRASTFVFFAIALLVASWFTVTRRRIRLPLAVGGALILCLGGVILGTGPDWARVPGPYLVTADQRSVDASALAAAKWARDHLPAGSRVAADRVNGALLSATGYVRPVTSQDGQRVAPLFFSHRLGKRERGLMVRARIQYVLVDRRLGHGLSHLGYYFESDVFTNGDRLTPAELTKFEFTPGMHAVYSNSNIVIYDAAAFASGSAPTRLADRANGGSSDAADPWLLGGGIIVAGVWAWRFCRSRRRNVDQLMEWLTGGLCVAMFGGLVAVPAGISSRAIGIGILALLFGVGIVAGRGGRPAFLRYRDRVVGANQGSTPEQDGGLQHQVDSLRLAAIHRASLDGVSDSDDPGRISWVDGRD